jgi:Co/Zn/Cd efflux system component
LNDGNRVRLTLSLIAFVSGLMGFIESTAAAPAQSTAMAGAALGFLLASALAWFELWASVDAFKNPQYILRGIGAVIALLGFGVLVVAGARLFYFSNPSAPVMALFACVGLIVNFFIASLQVKKRGESLTVRTIWTEARNDLGVSAVLFVAAVVVFVTGSNITDVALGGALAAIAIVTGTRIFVRGKVA